MALTATSISTVPVSEILTDALEIMGVVGSGQTASAEDYVVVLKSLQNILRELPLHGYTWPKITPEPVALFWSAAQPDRVSMPVDYFGSPSITRTAPDGEGRWHPTVYVITKAEYDRLGEEYIDPMANPSLEPQRIYIAPNNIGYLWPIPSTDPQLRLTYQAVTNDTIINMTPDVAQTWIGGFGLWVAFEACPKFGVDMATRADIQARFIMRRALMLAYAAETAPITFEVWD